MEIAVKAWFYVRCNTDAVYGNFEGMGGCGGVAHIKEGCL